MDLQKIIYELEVEKKRLDEAIEALERLSARGVRKRGRPPGWLAETREKLDEEPQAALPEGNHDGNNKPAS